MERALEMLLTLVFLAIAPSFFTGHISGGDYQCYIVWLQQEEHSQITPACGLSKSSVQILTGLVSAFHKTGVRVSQQYFFRFNV